MTTLYIRDGKRYQPATPALILKSAQRLIHRKIRPGARVLEHPEYVREFLRLRLAEREHEIFAAIFLDSRHRLIDYAELFRGTVDGSSVHAREVVKEALARNASAVI
jgi:DNA repair protein RadC